MYLEKVWGNSQVPEGARGVRWVAYGRPQQGGLAWAQRDGTGDGTGDSVWARCQTKGPGRGGALGGPRGEERSLSLWRSVGVSLNREVIIWHNGGD